LTTRSLHAAVAAEVGKKVPGVVVVVVRPERVEFCEAQGSADLSSGVAVESGTIFNWFSMTKPVTATAVAQLAERRVLDLDRPVRDYYPPFSLAGPETRSRAATVRHLLSHSSGLNNPLPTRWTHLATEPGPDRSQFVRTLLDKRARLRFDPGSKARYSNLGYLVLGEVIGAVSGQPYEDYVQQHLLQPLAMTTTGFTAAPGRVWATPYQRRRTVFNAVLPVVIPRKVLGPKHGRFRSLNHFYLDGASYGGLVGPATDAAQFLRAHLGDGALDGTRILSAESTRAMRTIQARGKGIEVGLGWYRRGDDPDRGFVEHLGGGAGFWTCMRLYPDHDVGVVVMGNATSYDHDAIATAAVAPLLHRSGC
jgi:CubicO group peptidase (beta-lactamase class C family)